MEIYMRLKNLSFRLTTIFSTLLFLIACGGGDEDSEPTMLKGQFLDNAVKGLSYKTKSQSGDTNEYGEFNYIAGETVTFSIGDLFFPSVEASKEITPVTMSPTKSLTDNVAVNIAWLMQSLDEDADLSNGISIKEQAKSVASAVDFNVSSNEFSSKSSIINLLANSGSTNTSLISLTNAKSHLEETVKALSYERMDTLEEYALIFDKKLVSATNINNYFYVRENGTFDGMWNKKNESPVPFTGTWVLDSSGYYCRTAIQGAAYILESVDCQMWRYQGENKNTITATRNKGVSDIWWDMVY